MYRLLLLILLSANPLLAQESPTLPASRSFALGFTPWPYDLTDAAVQETYSSVATYGDLIDHHIEGGIPWEESLRGTPFPQNLRDELNFRRSHRSPKVLVEVTPLNQERTGIALNRTESPNQPLPSSWQNRKLDDSRVRKAYLAYCDRLIRFFRPNYFVFGIEINELLAKNPKEWRHYLKLQQYVYSALKKRYPKLPLMVSLFGMSFLDGYTEDRPAQQRRELAHMLRSSDYLALSIYPYMSALLTSPIPSDLFSRLFALSKKPVAITESGYPAQTLSLSTGLTMPSSPEQQLAYLQLLLTSAQKRSLRFLVNFTVRDYDQLAEKLGGGDLVKVWRDTGFIDETGTARPTLDLWQSWHQLPLRSAK